MNISTELRKKSGVYSIVHTPTGKCYIGSSCDLYKRLNAHFGQLRNGTHYNHKLQKKYNLDPSDFDYEILDTCPQEILIDREQVFLDGVKLKFNIKQNADSGRPKEEAKERITVPKSRAESLEMLANFSNVTFEKAKKLILEALISQETLKELAKRREENEALSREIIDRRNKSHRDIIKLFKKN